MTDLQGIPSLADRTSPLQQTLFRWILPGPAHLCLCGRLLLPIADHNALGFAPSTAEVTFLCVDRPASACISCKRLRLQSSLGS